MHDLMFTKEILSALDGKINSIPKGSGIVAVNVSLSPLSHVKPETLTETFKAMTKGTRLENVALNIKVLQLEIECRSCKHNFRVNKPTTKCVKCDASDLDIVFNKEFLVDSIEVEKT